MKIIKKFLKESVNFNNIKSFLFVIIFTMICSPINTLRNGLIGGGIYILLAIVLWLLAEYCKPFRDFFSDKNTE